MEILYKVEPMHTETRPRRLARQLRLYKDLGYTSGKASCVMGKGSCRTMVRTGEVSSYSMVRAQQTTFKLRIQELSHQNDVAHFPFS